MAAREETEKAVKWFDNEKELWVMIVTRAKNSCAFSAGANLKEWLEVYSLPLVPGSQWLMVGIRKDYPWEAEIC
jgi:enoyl-CoA hydratase/carnithine racemase